MKYVAMKSVSTKFITTKFITMKCAQAKGLLSPYLDGAVTGAEMQALQAHLDRCPACMREYKLVRQTQQLLTSVARVKQPADLGLKLRLAISREAALTRRPRYEALRMRIENTLQAFMVPATAGLVCALLIFGLVTAILAIPGPLQANNQDVPLVLNTGPELQQSVFGTTLSSMNTDSLVIEAYVDKNGRVQDYKILSDPGESQALLPQVKRMLIFTTFRPAMSMGRPISSRAVLSFSRISVQG
ncbi:MAG TPA: zf-HC2 domain-containing protein [Candidatus Eremiobacteraceae bacterium]|nr:zf-HC2 domain-containing protein [Candidatus Eremiobacteraceae bacterium]